MLALHGITVTAIEKPEVLSDDDEFKEYTLQDIARMPAIGSRVKRGPNWRWGDQDGKGHGTVMAHVSQGTSYCYIF